MDEISEKEYQELYSNFSLREMEEFLDRVINVVKEEKIEAGAAGYRVAREMITEKPLGNLMFENHEKIYKLTQEATERVLSLPGGTHEFDVARDEISKATEGKIVPGSPETKHMIIRLLEISQLVRENFYIYYKYVDNKTLSEERKSLIEILKKLKSKALDNLEEFNDKKSWGTDVELSFRDEVNHIRDSIKVERKLGAGHPYDQPKSLTGKPFPPTSFDDNYYLFKKILDPEPYDIPCKDKFLDAIYFLDKHIELFNDSDMDMAGYRRYRIQCAGLTDEEVEIFDEHIKKCLGREREKHI